MNNEMNKLSHPQQPHHEITTQQAYFEQELSSILSTSEQQQNASRLLGQKDVDACKHILQECPEICHHRLQFGYRMGYGVHTHQAIFPLLQLCYRQAPSELIELAYDAYPDAIDDEDISQDSGGFTALHWACCGTFTSPDVVKFLVEKHPVTLYRTSWGHRTVLHHACENGLAAEIVQFLLQRCPHHTQERDNHQNVPLHLACGRSDASFEVIQLLIDFDPPTVELASQLGLMESHAAIMYRAGSAYNGTGYTALHYACGEGASFEVVRLLVRLYPAALRMYGGGMALPLHLACSRLLPSLNIIAFLASRYPRALQLSTSDGCSESCGGGGTPLQLCVKSRPSLDVVRFLYEQYPTGLVEAFNDSRPNLTLEYACLNGASSEVIGFLLEKTELIGPNTLRGASNTETFLHLTCSKVASHSLIPFMLERYPDDIQRVSVTGDLPLHAACQSRAPLCMIQLLVSKYPKSTHSRNNDGNLPLHLLVNRRTNSVEKMIDVNLLRFLVEQNVEALSQKNRHNQIPFDLALSFLFPGPSPSLRQSYISHTSFYEEMEQKTPIDALRLLTPRVPDYQYTSGLGERVSRPLHYIVSQPKLLYDESHKTTNSMSRLHKVFSYFCEKDPESFHRANDLCEMPLHIASRTEEVALMTIECLFAAYPDAIQTPNRDGLYPFELVAATSDSRLREGSESESLGVVYFLVHRSLFVFENLTRWREHDFLHSRLCDLDKTSDENTKKFKTEFERERHHYQQQTLTEILEQREEAMNARLNDLERELLELRRQRQADEIESASGSCCIIS